MNIWSYSDSDSDITEMLKDLPDALDATYIRRLERIGNPCSIELGDTMNTPIRQRAADKRKQIGRNTLRWTAWAARPLKPQEARELISINVNDQKLDMRNVLNLSPTDYCANLVTFDFAS
jgi:hypothetical protein